MLISFFEEFPDTKTLSKLKLIKFPTKLYLGAKSLGEFLRLKKKIKSKHITEIIYWPLLEKKESYWISPFSQRKALLRIFEELKEQKKVSRIPVMLDLELPTRWKPSLYITQLFNFCRNKKLIRNFINNYPGEVYLAEYYPEGKWKEKMMQLLGIHYKNHKVKVIKMLYHSMHHFSETFLRKELLRGKAEFGNNYLIGLGTIAKGIDGNEPILLPELLKRDLKLAEKCGIKEVVVFRLGGLNEKYVKTLASS